MYLVSIYFKNGDSVFYHTKENYKLDHGYLVVNSTYGRYIFRLEDIKQFDIDFVR